MYRLKDLCDTYGFSLRRLADDGVLMKERPFEVVTFVDNHDFFGNDCFMNDKMFAYAFILTHGGYPCVFWKDYYNYGLGLPGEPSGIERLVQAHEKYAGGATNIIYLDDLFYAMERTGAGSHPGLVFAPNNSGETIRKWVKCGVNGRSLKPDVWRGKYSMAHPQLVKVNGDGWVEIEAPSRGYVVYCP